ncbi:hypothetical protein [uncultured Microbacterium sp.]|uniref:hypothetical protein n=1 Tax=uncultured Microbacterium sp. TaxID=191216 RepID=UPI0028D014EE|nr:hypothetical protein [uncultured Microbacterium sp.]
MPEFDRPRDPQDPDHSTAEVDRLDGISATWSQTDINAFLPKIDTSWIADLESLLPKIDTSWIADLTPQLDTPWIKGLDAFVPKTDTSWIADLESLLPKTDTSWIADLESLLPRFDSSWFDLLGDVVRQRVRSFPPNWSAVSTIEIFDDDKLRSVILDEGIPLAWVPGSSLIERLLAARDAADRRELIRNGWRGIVSDCVRAATGLPSREGRMHARFITLGALAIRDGHYEAAQALAANLIDTLGNLYVKATVAGYSWTIVTSKNLRPKLSALTMRTLMILGPLAVGHTAFRPDDAIPRAFSRHATAHGVSRRQYTRVNSLIALMNATALLCWLERDCGAFQTD